MEDKQRDVVEALEFFDTLDQEQQQIALAYLRELDKGAA